jgi:hypothetical protein
MTDLTDEERFRSGQARFFSRLSTVSGVCLLAVGLDLGGSTTAGLVCGLAGVVLGLVPVLLDVR